MGTLDLKKFLLGSSLMLGVAAFGFTPAAIAQDDDGVAVIEEDADEASDDGDRDEVIVTGSRLKRDTFNSIAPLQVISGDVSREAGLIDPADILQTSTASTGTQIDTTFQGFVLDNGPGASTVDLRGLGASRTLTLINGRRVAPAGVEGAPTVPDLNLLPGALVDRFEVLLDGASSIYGSDAVTGVVNAILRKDFDGLELELFTDQSIHGGGTYSVSGAWGKNYDRGFFAIGGEYVTTDEIKTGDRPWTDGCDRHLEIDENGRIRDLGIDNSTLLGQTPSPCKIFPLAGRAAFPNFGSLYFIPGQSNSGIPNFNESSLFGVAVDADGNGSPEVNFIDFSTNGLFDDVDTLFPDFERISIASFGEYTFEGDSNLTPYYEVIYSQRETAASNAGAQLFPDVLGTNPFNPCNTSTNGGFDCATGFNDLLANPNYVADFVDYFNGGFGSPNCFGFVPNVIPREFCTPAAFGLGSGPVGDATVTPILTVRGDRERVESEVSQLRLVGGLRGDLPSWNKGDFGNWSYDLSFSYSKSEGDAIRSGVNEEKLNFALGQQFDANGQLFALPGGPCVADPANPITLTVDTTGCVPVNLFAPSLYNGLIGDFATQAERDFVFDDRTFDTTYEQTIFSGFLTGDLFSVPAGTVSAVFGIEHRIDDIESTPNAVAAEGQLFGFFLDEGASGDKTTTEYFAEIGLPIFANKPYAKELDLEASVRYTDDEFYGGATTYAAKVGWRPIDPLLIRGTVGTSFRAPNLRELFLANQSGFLTLFDPCVTPEAAIGIAGGYDPSLDGRDQITLDNCVIQGVDPTNFDPNGNNSPFYSVEINRSGALFDDAVGLDGLDPEESDSYSAGFVFEQPFFENFDLTLSASYYDIELSDAIVELSPSFILFQCYTVEPNGSSPRCDDQIRNLAGDGRVTNVEAGFENLDEFSTSGIDFNLLYQKELTLFGEPVDLTIDVNVNKTLDLTQESFNPQTGNLEPENFVGQPGVPEYKGLIRYIVDFDKYRVNWTTNYIDEMEVADIREDVFSNVVDGGSETCLGTFPEFGFSDVNCRDVDFVDEYWLHSVSLYYRGDSWTIGGGVRNVFDKEPPQVDGSEILAVNNTPIGLGYDLNGRTFFFNVAKDFN